MSRKIEKMACVMTGLGFLAALGSVAYFWIRTGTSILEDTMILAQSLAWLCFIGIIAFCTILPEWKKYRNKNESGGN